MTQLESVTLNGVTYPIADMNEAARSQLNNIQVVDAEIVHLQQKIAIAQTARNAYVGALTAAVGAPTEPPQTVQ